MKKTIITAIALLALSACNQEQVAQAAPRRVADPTILAIKAKLEEVAPRGSECYVGSGPSSYVSCRNFRVVCAKEVPITDADAANGVARKMTFIAAYLFKPTSTAPWFDGTQGFSFDVDANGYFKMTNDGVDLPGIEARDCHVGDDGKITYF